MESNHDGDDDHADGDEEDHENYDVGDSHDDENHDNDGHHHHHGGAAYDGDNDHDENNFGNDDEDAAALVFQEVGNAKENLINGNKTQQKKGGEKREKSYADMLGKLRKARIMKLGCSLKCRYKCKNSFTQKYISALFEFYWKLSSYDKQQQFLLRNTIRKVKKVKTKSVSRRK